MKGRSAGQIVNQTTTTSSNRRTNEEEALTEPVDNEPRRSMKHTMPIQLTVDNNIVQIHCNIVWKISRKNVL